MKSVKSPRMMAAAFVVALGGIATLAMQTVPELILFRERLVLSVLHLESDAKLEPFDMKTHDGLTLRSWYKQPEAGKPVIVYFPGRVGDLVKKPSHLFKLAEDGYGLLLAGYRGYGGNPGRPSETHLYGDAAGLLAKLAVENMAPDGTILYGYSMGTGIASYAASQVKPRAVILEAPFTSFRDAVRQQAGRAPVWLVRTQFDTRSRIGEIDVPILLMAGGQDQVTPATFAEKLAALNETFASLHIFKEAGHGDMFAHGALEAVTGFFEQFRLPELLPDLGGGTAQAAPLEPVTP
jgi:pimeloyl-ACP methyl ester carboxylesterase